MRNLFVAISALVIGAGCSSSSNDGNNNGNGGQDGCLETLPGCETSVCVGNYVRSCNDDGTAYEYELCWGQICKDGVCKAAACTDPGRKECTGQSSYDLCLENQTMKSSKECSDGTKCASGACVETSCKAGDKACGWESVLTCKEDGTSWSVEECGENQYCDETSHLCLEIDPFCLENPKGSRCQDLETTLNCDSNGAISAHKCGKNEICVDGFCQPEVCGVTYERGTAPDVVAGTDLTDPEDITIGEIDEEVTIDIPIPKDIPPLDPIPKAWCTLNGGGEEFEMYEIKFTSAKEANYVFKDKDLQVSMAKGMFLMEVHFMGIEEGVVGNFTSDEPGSVEVWIVLNDGTTNQEEVQWKWQNVSFNATLDQFAPVDGWVKGTFSGVLEMDPAAGQGEPVEVIDGYFEVPRKN